MGQSIDGEFHRRPGIEPAAGCSPKLTEAQRELLRNDAERVQFSRQLRRKLFGSAMFAETAWDILLTLYLADRRELPLEAAKLAERFGSPFSTTLRWLSYLDDAGLVTSASESGGLAAGAELSEEGRRLLDSYFIELRDANIFGASDPVGDSKAAQ